MKKLLGISLMALMVAQSATAAETQKTYAGLSVGQTTSKIDLADWEYDSNINFSLVYGVKLNKLFRVEGELTHYAKAEYSEYTDWVGITENTYSSNYSATTLMANAYFTAPIDFAIKPYIGFGLGFASTSWDYTNVDDPSKYGGGSIITDTTSSSSTEFAYQAMIGLDFDLVNSPWAFSLEYKSFWTTPMLVNDSEDLASQSFNLKARYAF